MNGPHTDDTPGIGQSFDVETPSRLYLFVDEGGDFVIDQERGEEFMKELKL